MVLALAGGAWIFGAFLIIGFFAVVLGYFTELGSGIRYHPWGNPEGGAPGARGPSDASGHDPMVDVRTLSRGTATSGRRRRHVARRRPERELADHAHPEVIAKLAAWRDRLGSSGTQLTQPVDPARDHVAGRPEAPVTLVEYTDFECPSCRAAAGVLRRLRDEMGDDLCFVVRHFPVADAHPHAFEAAEAVESAAAQGRFWDMHDAIYRRRHPPDPEGLRRCADKLDLDMDRFERELRDHVHAPRVVEDLDSGIRSGVNGTPTLYLNGERWDGDNEYGELRAALEGAAGVTGRRGAA